MARTRPADRVASLIDAAIRVFCRKGFRRAHMADIAREMGVSPGLLYNYVESKEALFYLVVDQGFGQESVEETLELPVKTPAPGAIVKRIAERFRTAGAMPALAAAIRRPRADDPRGELEEVVRALYAMVLRSATATTMIERSALELPGLADLFYRRMRSSVVERLSRLIESRAEARQYRRVPHPAVAARLIIETITWFARNRLGDPASESITDKAAEETVVDFIVNSLLADRARHARTRAR